MSVIFLFILIIYLVVYLFRNCKSVFFVLVFDKIVN